MSRPQRQTVDFFPHYCTSGKTIFILKSKYGNNGYAFWFQLLEELGCNDGHKLDLNSEEYCEFLSAKTLVSVTEMMDILDLLSRLSAIDSELWKNKIVWSQNFVDNLVAVYSKRVVSAPERPVSVTETPVSGDRNPQSRVEYSRVEESIVALQEIVDHWNGYKTTKEAGLPRVTNKTAMARLLPRCAKVSDKMLKAYKKLGFTNKEIKAAIKNYILEIVNRPMSSDYCNHRFSLYEFLKQDNGAEKFINQSR